MRSAVGRGAARRHFVHREAGAMPRIEAVSRRRMLQFLSASPLFARRALAETAPPADPMIWAPRDPDRRIADPKDAIDVFDFEPVMKQNVLEIEDVDRVLRIGNQPVGVAWRPDQIGRAHV